MYTFEDFGVSTASDTGCSGKSGLTSFFCRKSRKLKALSQATTFLATCNASLLFRDAKLVNMRLNYTFLMSSSHISNILYQLTSFMSRIALQVARKIAACDSASEN